MLYLKPVNKNKFTVYTPRDDYEASLIKKGYKIVKKEKNDNMKDGILTFRKGRSIIRTGTVIEGGRI